MKKYICENFSTNHKPNYDRHLQTKKHNNVTPKSTISQHFSENCHQFVTPKSPICHPKMAKNTKKYKSLGKK